MLVRLVRGGATMAVTSALAVGLG
ncbi:MAG: hypothetical protein QOE38_1902, partial [Thermoleophilaceae bacterium]|nr:hypothetical protein [Thermoleophilaceae bacterium]